jgi:hypothetical protein
MLLLIGNIIVTYFKAYLKTLVGIQKISQLFIGIGI